MKLYLVQHGEAKSKEHDPDRSLTEAGIKQTKKIAAWLGRHAVSVTEIYHSWKKRADQTAEIFADRLAPENGVTAMTGLNPNDDVQPIAEKLDETTEPIMIIGHLPFLGRLAGLLLTGGQDQEVISYVNSGVVCLERKDGQWYVNWAVVPDMIPEPQEV